MTDWRSIPVKDIDWRMLHAKFGRSIYALEWLAVEPRNNRVEALGHGCWSHMTLGAVADIGERLILRHHGIGPVALATLRSIIDLAASDGLPMVGGPAPDALTPTSAAPSPAAPSGPGSGQAG